MSERHRWLPRPRAPFARPPVLQHWRPPTASVDGDALVFRCNICSSPCRTALTDLQRERISCAGCGSTPRARAVINALSTELFGVSLELSVMPARKDLVGLGLSDWEGYAARLAARFNYTNTYLHREPRLDINCHDVRFDGRVDFMIASDVFEHVEPPVGRAFAHARRLLKPHGVLILTVPYAPAEALPHTVEHFPELHDYTIAAGEGGLSLVNRTRDGRVQVFDDLIFHDGEGLTLEMRRFSEPDLRHELAMAGFGTVKIYREPTLDYGIYWPEPWSLPVAARA